MESFNQQSLEKVGDAQPSLAEGQRDSRKFHLTVTILLPTHMRSCFDRKTVGPPGFSVTGFEAEQAKSLATRPVSPEESLVRHLRQNLRH